jgi:hypothetical protein
MGPLWEFLLLHKGWVSIHQHGVQESGRMLLQVMLAIGGYGLCCLLNCTLDELIPIYASAAVQTG